MQKFKKKSIVLLHGMIEERFLDRLPKGGRVFICEGRPDLEGCQYLADKLLKRNITPTVIADNMAGFLFYQGWVKEVWVASRDRIKDGMLCGIGALILGVLAKRHGVTVKCFSARTNKRLLGAQKDLSNFLGKRIAPIGAKGYVPLVEFVPNQYITKYDE